VQAKNFGRRDKGPEWRSRGLNLFGHRRSGTVGYSTLPYFVGEKGDGCYFFIFSSSFSFLLPSFLSYIASIASRVLCQYSLPARCSTRTRSIGVRGEGARSGFLPTIHINSNQFSTQEVFGVTSVDRGTVRPCVMRRILAMSLSLFFFFLLRSAHQFCSKLNPFIHPTNRVVPASVVALDITICT